jgi:hypothetical protein
MPAMGRYHSRLDRFDQLWQMAGQLGALHNNFDGGGNRPAIGMAKDQEQRRAEELHGVFDTRQSVVTEEIAGEPNHEQVAGALIEDKVRHHAAVGAAQDRGDWELGRSTRRAPR